MSWSYFQTFKPLPQAEEDVILVKSDFFLKDDLIVVGK